MWIWNLFLKNTNKLSTFLETSATCNFSGYVFMLLHVCTVSKNPKLYPLTYDFAKMHSAKAAVAVCSPQRTPTSGRFLMDSPSRGSVSWAFAKFGCGYYVWIDLALNLLQSSGFSIQSLNSSTQNEFFFTNGAWNSVGLATYALNASILFSHGAKERIRILQSTTHAHGMCFTSNVWMVGFVKGVAFAKQMEQQIWGIKTQGKIVVSKDGLRGSECVDCRLSTRLCARPPLWRLSPWGFAKALQAYLWSCEGLKRPMFGYNQLLSVSRFHDLWEWTSCTFLSKLCIFMGALCDVNLATKVANAKTPKGDSCHLWCNDPNTPVHVSPVVGSQKGSWTTELYSWPKKGWTQNLKWEALWLFEEFAKSRDFVRPQWLSLPWHGASVTITTSFSCAVHGK